MAADPASAKGANKFLDPDLRPIPASVALLATSVATDAIVLVVYSSCFRSQLGPIDRSKKCVAALSSRVRFSWCPIQLCEKP